MEGLMTPGVEFISIQKTKNELDIFLKDSTDQLDELFLQQETFISTLPRQPRKINGFFDYYFSLYQLQESFLNDKLQIKDVFKTIAKWIVHRLETKESFPMPKNKKWIHPITGELFKNLGLTYMLFEDIDFMNSETNTRYLSDGMKVRFFLKIGR